MIKGDVEQSMNKRDVEQNALGRCEENCLAVDK